MNEELKQSILNLNTKVSDLLNEFQRENGCKIADLSIDTLSMADCMPALLVVQVSIKP